MSCPICDGPIPNAEYEGQYKGALSRRDNKTEICSDCGVMEAVEDYNRRSTIVEPFTKKQLSDMGNPTYVTENGWVTWD
jgi:hypothetical protein